MRGGYVHVVKISGSKDMGDRTKRRYLLGDRPGDVAWRVQYELARREPNHRHSCLEPRTHQSHGICAKPYLIRDIGYEWHYGPENRSATGTCRRCKHSISGCWRSQFLYRSGAGASLARTRLCSKNRVFSAVLGLKSARKGSFIAIYPHVNGRTGRENNREFCGRIRAACDQIRVADADIRDSYAGRNSSRLYLIPHGGLCHFAPTNGRG